jgi:hypothetical protein
LSAGFFLLYVQYIEKGVFNYGFGRFVLWHLIFKISGAKVAQVAHWRTLEQVRHLSLKTCGQIRRYHFL